MPIDAVTGKAMASVHQKFSIKFVKKGDVDQVVQGKSGNPGYIDGLPVLIGRKDAASGAMQLYEDGFRIRGGDATGQCLKSTDAELGEMGDPTLRFSVDLSYGCSIKMTLSELQENCDLFSSPIASLELFNNLD